MIILFCFIALITAGLLLGPYLADNTGYVLFAFNSWTVELTLMSLAIILVSSGLIIWSLYRATKFSGKALVQSGQWLHRRTSIKQDDLAHLAMLKHLLLNIEHGSKLVVTAMDTLSERDTSPLSIFLRSIQLTMTGDYQAARLCINSVAKTENQPEHNAVIAASQVLSIILAIRTDDSTGAYQAYQELPKKHDFIIELLPVELPLLCHVEGFDAASQRLNHVKKSLSQAEYQQWQVNLMHQQLSAIASKDGGNGMSDYWHQAKRRVRNNVNHQQAYLTVLTELNLHNKASDYLISVSGKSCIDVFFPVIEALRPTTPVAIKKQLEIWLKQSPKKPGLLRAYAHFCANNGEETLAINSFTALFAVEPLVDDALALAALYEHQGLQSDALALYKKLPELTK